MNTLDVNDIFAEHYLLKERLSTGQVAEVWKAEDWSANGALVTLRLFAPGIQLDSYTLDMLGKEQHSLHHLKHPHLLLPYQSGVQDGIPYQVMPYLAEGPLSRIILTEGPLPEKQLALFLHQVASALSYLHAQQPAVVHRSISPDHIFLSEEGDYLLTGPSLSSQLRTALQKATGTALPSNTAYAAPELFSSHPVHSEASDVFALGVTLYELCTGELPWLGNGGLSLSKGAKIPYLPGPYARELSNLLRACLHPEPEKRPSAQVLAEEAEYFLENGKWKPYGAFGDVTAESIVYKKRSPKIALLATFVVLLALAAAAYFLYLSDKVNFFGKNTVTEKAITPDSLVKKNTQPETDTATSAEQAVVPPPTSQSERRTSLPQQSTQHEPAPPTKARRASPPPQPAYPRPTNLEGYLNGLLNDEIPLRVREQWRPAIRKYFTHHAIIYARMNGSPLGSFGVSEFLDILLSSQTGSTIRIDDIIRSDTDKIEELSVNISTAE